MMEHEPEWHHMFLDVCVCVCVSGIRGSVLAGVLVPLLLLLLAVLCCCLCCGGGPVDGKDRSVKAQTVLDYLKPG